MFSEETYNVSPEVYQEYIEGTTHLRLLNFGRRSHCGLIGTDEVDWRPNLNVPVTPWTVPDDVHGRVRRIIELLGLEMGIVDIKVTPGGELVWLEVNPHRQLLFVEPLTGISFLDTFSRLLIEEARALG